VVLTRPFTEEAQVPTGRSKARSGPLRLVGARPPGSRPLSFDFDLDDRIGQPFVAVDSVYLLLGQLIQDTVDIVLGMTHDARERGLDPRETRQIEDQSIPPQTGRLPGQDLDPTASQDGGVHVGAKSKVVSRHRLTAAV
jgi:hypothetical protein